MPGLSTGEERCHTGPVTATDSWDMPLRTKLLVRALNRSRGSEHMTVADEIARSRAWFAPARGPWAWVTGPIPSGAEIGAPSLEARDRPRVDVRTSRPRRTERQALPAMLWFHGGGWVLGN